MLSITCTRIKYDIRYEPKELQPTASMVDIDHANAYARGQGPFTLQKSPAKRGEPHSFTWVLYYVAS